MEKSEFGRGLDFYKCPICKKEFDRTKQRCQGLGKHMSIIHRITIKEWYEKNIKRPLCKCGCRTPTTFSKHHTGWNAYIVGHGSRNKMPKGKRHHNWKGGIKKHSAGYIEIRVYSEHLRKDKSGYVKEHILIMEKHLGRFIKLGEVIHHLDGNKHNNKIENLILCKGHSEHRKIHFEMEKLVYSLIKDGKVIYDGKKFKFKK